MRCKKYSVWNAWMAIISASVLFFYSACNSSGNQQKEAGDFTIHKESLRNFILNTVSFTNIQSVTRLDSILLAAGKDSAFFHQTIDFLEKPLSDPNSLYRNEDLYTELLRAKIKSPLYDSIEKAQSREKLY